jgi:hypothetical protein
MSKLSTKVKAEVPAAAIGKLYARLDDEATPHALHVKKGTRAGAREIVINCNITAARYFERILRELML